MSSVCPSCGQPTTPGAVFCDNCGNKLDAGAPPTPMGMPQGGMAPCAACGFGNVPGAAFCENCGAALSVAPPPAPPVNVPPPPAPAAFTPPAPPAPPQQAEWQAPASATVSGSFEVVSNGTIIPIPTGRNEILIGREDPVSGNFPDIDLDPHDGLNQGVSRQHCKLSMQGSQLMVEDLNAVNKTHLHGQQLTPGQKAPLNNGDELVLGRLRLTYHS